MKLNPSVERFGRELISINSNNSFVVFLCGPTLSETTKPGSMLRKKIKDELEVGGFEVILGEDDGLESLRKEFDGLAHENELHFIEKESGAIVLIADSVGSFCELGLFAYTYYTKNENNTDFILLLEKKFEGHKSYLNEGPKAAIENFGGLVLFDNFETFDISPILKRLKVRRTVWFTHGKGRPKGK